MKFTKVDENTFKNIQLNAGILCDSFTVESGTIGKILGSTSGGCQFSSTPTYSDFGEGIDNMPANMKELKKLMSIDAKLSGSFISVSADLVKTLIGSADIDDEDNTHIIPRSDILKTDFKDIWWIGDYSDENGEENGGYIAIHIMNALNTSGFSIQSADKGKGTFSFEFTAHYSMEEQTKIPYEIYVKAGTPD